MCYAVLIRVSPGYPAVMGRLHTRYAPVRRSPPSIATRAAPRLACIRPAASVHPEPGSNSPLYYRSYAYNLNSFYPALANKQIIQMLFVCLTACSKVTLGFYCVSISFNKHPLTLPHSLAYHLSLNRVLCLQEKQSATF